MRTLSTEGDAWSSSAGLGDGGCDFDGSVFNWGGCPEHFRGVLVGDMLIKQVRGPL
jgi:hypothetical protein